jgi:phosphopantothenoylcysteine decarboxylase/phosphopantothenate--cysteine ligase
MPVSHPTLDLYGTVSRSLAGKKIVLAVTGSIAAVETIKLARELIRHGAEVQAVMSTAAQTIIHPYALQYATGRDVITEITGNVEHVAFCGVRKEAYDLLLIAPCTANTIGKIAAGVDDTPVTTFATTAIGSKIPVIIVPAMHGSMMEHAIVQENIRKLESIGIQFVMPVTAEKIAKFPDNQDDLQHERRRAAVPSQATRRGDIITPRGASSVSAPRSRARRSTTSAPRSASQVSAITAGPR